MTPRDTRKLHKKNETLNMSMGRYAQQPLQVVYECFDQEGNSFDIFIFLNEHKQY